MNTAAASANSQLLFNGVLVVGQFFLPDESRRIAAAIVKGEKLRLEAEPSNPHDPNAVLVCKGATRVGYLPKEIAPTAGLFLKNGFEVDVVVIDTNVNKHKNFTVLVAARRV